MIYPINSIASNPAHRPGALANVIPSLAAGWLAGCCYLLHRPVAEASAPAIFSALGLAWMLMCGPRVLAGAIARRRRARTAWFTSEPMIALLLILCVLIGGSLLRLQTVAAPIFIAIIGAGLFLALLAPLFRSANRLRVALILAAPLVYVAFTGGIAWGGDVQTPLFLSAIAGNGHDTHYLANDSFYHAALCNLIRTFGKPTIGLDGPAWQHYHFGSHALFAAMSNLLDISVIDFYHAAYMVICPPLLLYAILLFANPKQGEPTDDPADSVSISRRVLPWIILGTGLLTPFPLALSTQMGLNPTAIYISESMCVGLAEAILLLAIGREWFLESAENGARGTSWALGPLLVFPLGMVVVYLTKPPLACVLFVVSIYYYIRFAYYRRWFITMGLLAATCLLYTCLRLTINPYHVRTTSLMLWGYAHKYIDTPWRLWFYPLSAFWLFVYVAWRLIRERRETGGGIRRQWVDKKLLDVEFAVVLGAVAIAPGIFFDFAGGNAYYFFKFQQVVCVVMLFRWLCSDTRAVSEGSPARRMLTRVGWRIGVAMLAVVFAVNMEVVWERALHVHDDCVKLTLDTFSRDPRRPIDPALAGRTNVVRELVELDKTPLSEKRNTLLFIPKTNGAYWNLMGDLLTPTQPMVAPALSGMAMIDGLPDPQVRRAVDVWGYYADSPRPTEAQRRVPVEELREGLCGRARDMGFMAILVLEVDEQGQVKLTRWPCQ